MKIERIQVHFPSAQPGPHGAADQHQRVTGSDDAPDRRRKYRQPDDHAEADKDLREQAERLQVDVVKTPDSEKESSVQVSTGSPHLLDIKA
jgi:hypothetical protein